MRDRDTILLEQAYNQIHLLQEDVKLAKQLVEQGKLSQEDFNTIVSSMERFPDCRKHIGWMAKQWIAGAKNIDDLRNNVTEWETLAKRGKTSYKDISKYTFESLKNEVQNANNQGLTLSSGELERDFEVVQDDQNLLIVCPHAHEASRKHGLGEFACRVAEDGSKDSKWCTTHRTRTHFDKYYFNYGDTLYYIKVRSNVLQKQLTANGFGSEFYVSAVSVLGPNRLNPTELKEHGNLLGYDSLDKPFRGEKLNQYLSIIGINAQGLVTRRAKEKRDKNYKIALQQQIREYIKNGSQGNLEFSESPITSLPDNLKVGGDLSLVECPNIINLPQNLTVGGLLDLTGSVKVNALPKGLSVGKNVFASSTSIDSISPDIQVKGSLYVDYTPIAKRYTPDQLKKMLPGVSLKIYAAREEDGDWSAGE